MKTGARNIPLSGGRVKDFRSSLCEISLYSWCNIYLYAFQTSRKSAFFFFFFFDFFVPICTVRRKEKKRLFVCFRLRVWMLLLLPSSRRISREPKRASLRDRSFPIVKRDKAVSDYYHHRQCSCLTDTQTLI